MIYYYRIVLDLGRAEGSILAIFQINFCSSTVGVLIGNKFSPTNVYLQFLSVTAIPQVIISNNESFKARSFRYLKISINGLLSCILSTDISLSTVCLISHCWHHDFCAVPNTFHLVNLPSQLRQPKLYCKFCVGPGE